MSDLYLGDKILDEDVYLDDNTRLHPNGNDMEMQIKVDDVWVTQQVWGS